jgi:hypothetical protein
MTDNEKLLLIRYKLDLGEALYYRNRQKLGELYDSSSVDVSILLRDSYPSVQQFIQKRDKNPSREFEEMYLFGQLNIINGIAGEMLNCTADESFYELINSNKHILYIRTLYYNDTLSISNILKLSNSNMTADDLKILLKSLIEVGIVDYNKPYNETVEYFLTSASRSYLNEIFEISKKYE